MSCRGVLLQDRHAHDMLARNHNHTRPLLCIELLTLGSVLICALQNDVHLAIDAYKATLEYSPVGCSDSDGFPNECSLYCLDGFGRLRICYGVRRLEH